MLFKIYVTVTLKWWKRLVRVIVIQLTNNRYSSRMIVLENDGDDMEICITLKKMSMCTGIKVYKLSMKKD